MTDTMEESGTKFLGTVFVISGVLWIGLAVIVAIMVTMGQARVAPPPAEPPAVTAPAAD